MKSSTNQTGYVRSLRRAVVRVSGRFAINGNASVLMSARVPSVARADRQRRSKTEKQQQVDAGALDAPERRARVQRLRVGEGRAQPENARQVVLDGRLVVRVLAELPAEPGDQPGRDLLADRSRFGPAPKSPPARSRGCRGRSRSRSPTRAASARKPAASVPARDQQLLLLRRRQLVGRRVEHDQRQDVGLDRAAACWRAAAPAAAAAPKMLTRVSTPEMMRVTVT